MKQSVRIETSFPISGFTSCSRFPPESIGIFQRYDNCDKKCENKVGEIFSMKANPNWIGICIIWNRFTQLLNKGQSSETSFPISGFTSGSPCFPLDFGGECSGIPQRCDNCDKKCENKTGEIFSIKANSNWFMYVLINKYPRKFTN